MGDIMVSVLCTAYNHEKYIKQCLDGFILQKTNFKFEVLVHDDCSTDATADIIREYERKYPKIIKGVYQKENQYSKNVSIFGDILLPDAQGKYIAMCEGDDYWVDENKLQIQVDYMEQHPDCTFCFGDAWTEEEDVPDVKSPFLWNNYWHGEGGYTCEEMIKLPTPRLAGFFYKKKDYPDLNLLISDKIKMGDKPLAVALTAKGYAWGSARRMTVYRRQVPESASTQWRKSLEKYYQSRMGIVEVYDKLNQYTNYRFNDIFEQMKKNVFICEDCIIAEQDIFALCNRVWGVYIYGAGFYAEQCALYLYQHDISFDGFVVSDRKKVKSSFLGFPVYEYHEIQAKKNIGFITALNKKNLLEVENNLVGHNWCKGVYERN